MNSRKEPVCLIFSGGFVNVSSVALGIVALEAVRT